ncbi:hypothetical protein L1987_77320 [Smallanthus sonchifolius]|uniref:Uncharacterized protein n=1 Tax=Smallanthus sonchifolius TaxID=185202 RepID=A0ACB8Z9H5_9ASTR|nr:hypothetical protein L1987_77320 [Smallanthus sonchifolius]
MSMSTVAKIARSLLTLRSPSLMPTPSVASLSDSLRVVNLNRSALDTQVRFYNGVNIQKMKFPKYRKGRIEGVRDGGNEICFGKYALQALEPARISAKQIESGRRALQMNVRRGGKGGKVWVRVFPYKSVTSKPSETRMGRGKGAISYWVAPVKAGQILYEMGGVTESLAKKAIQIAGSKMPIQTRSIIRDPKTKEIGVR